MLFRPATAAVGEALGVPHSLVRNIGVRLQAARIVPVGGRGRGGLLLSPSAIGALVCAILITDKQSRAVELFRRYASLPCVASPAVLRIEDVAPGEILGVPSAWNAVKSLARGHTVHSLLTALLEDAVARRLTGPCLAFVELRASTPMPMITLGLTATGRDFIVRGDRLGRMLATAAPSATYVNPIVLHDDIGALAAQARDSYTGEPSGAFSTERAIALDGIAAIGEAMARA